MAAAVSSHQHITIKKSLFFTKLYYKPTQSRIRAMVLDYSPSEGERLERLLNMPANKINSEIQRKGKPVTDTIGNFRLEICLSDDHQFCAVQLFRFSDYSYHAVIDPRFYEGNDSEQIAKLF